MSKACAIVLIDSDPLILYSAESQSLMFFWWRELATAGDGVMSRRPNRPLLSPFSEIHIHQTAKAASTFDFTLHVRFTKVWLGDFVFR